MALQEQREVYSHAIIDCSDMTLTEYGDDGVCTHSITEILKRWEGIPDLMIEIRQSVTMPMNER